MSAEYQTQESQQRIESVSDLDSAFTGYLLEQPGHVISAVEDHLQKMGSGKSLLWKAQRLKTLGYELSEDFSASLLPQDGNGSLDSKEARRRQGLEAAPATERLKYALRNAASAERRRNRMNGRNRA